MAEGLKYLTGFGNHFSSEALHGALPIGRNSPQVPPYGLIAELLSGTAFTAKRHENQRSWLYRIRPSVVQGRYVKMDGLERWQTAPVSSEFLTPQQLRWNAQPDPQGSVNFLQGVKTVAANGDGGMRHGSAIHLYAANTSMGQQFFYNADGEMLIVPQSGALLLNTEFGCLHVSPLEIVVIPRGVKFQVELPDGKASGYIMENYGSPFALPQLGPIGSNGLANPRDFEYPVAAYSEVEGEFTLVSKFAGQFFATELNHSPCDVVAWHGNLAPYKYNLKFFNTINTVSFDHPDPSIFTVLTSPTDHEGCANVDFVIFPPRWMVAEDTFRPPYFHRNVMSEYMGLIEGVYDAKPAGGFDPGGGSLHSCMSPHGPEAGAFYQALKENLQPHYQKSTMAFMFESSYIYKPTEWAMTGGLLQENYSDCWQGISPTFNKKKP